MSAAKDWLLPAGFRRWFRRWREETFSPRLPENQVLAGREQSRDRCFVIGNGPSLGDMDLSPLAGEFVIVANSFYKHPQAAQIRPSFICIGDPHFMQDSSRAVEWHRIVASSFPDAAFLLHADGRALRARHDLYPGRPVHYFTLGRRAESLEDVRVDFSRGLTVGRTTGSLLMIPLAIYLGIRRIYLLGMDCNWLDDPGKSYHFYGSHDQFPEFTSLATDTRGFEYEDLLRIVTHEFESHRFLRAWARNRGIEIVNLTRGGRLDVYPRADFEAIRDRVKT